MGSAKGARRAAARRHGLAPEEYERRLAAGEKWCTGCKAWHSRDAFAIDRSRGDGRKVQCRAWAQRRYQETYEPRPRTRSGPPRGPRRDGDRRQARALVNHMVVAGELPRPNAVPCSRCGHVWTEGERRHEYHHHRGYAAEHHADVIVVCMTCHREADREESDG